jgi:hypothetical protein
MRKLLVFVVIVGLTAVCPALEITQTFNGGSFPADWTPYVGTNSGDSFANFQTGSLGGYIDVQFERNNQDDGVAKVFTSLGSFIPSGTAAGSVPKFWYQFDARNISCGTSSANIWAGIFNSNGDADGLPAAITREGANMRGDAAGTVTTASLQGGGTNRTATGGPDIRVKIYVYPDGTKASHQITVYALDSAGNETQLYMDDGITLVGGGTWLSAATTVTYDSFGVVVSPSSSSVKPHLLFDNFYFSTDGAFSGAMPVPFVAPEPATMALLSIGGLLFIRRRK